MAFSDTLLPRAEMKATEYILRLDLAWQRFATGVLMLIGKGTIS